MLNRGALIVRPKQPYLDWAAGVTIGMNAFGSLMVVVRTPRGSGSRTISVRKADPKERRNYEKGV